MLYTALLIVFGVVGYYTLVRYAMDKMFPLPEEAGDYVPAHVDSGTLASSSTLNVVNQYVTIK